MTYILVYYISFCVLKYKSILSSQFKDGRTAALTYEFGAFCIRLKRKSYDFWKRFGAQSIWNANVTNFGDL